MLVPPARTLTPRPLGARARARSALALTVLALLPLTLGCAATHSVRPLGSGNAAAHGSLGGPLVTVGSAVIPAPILSLGGALGVGARSEVTLNADVTAVAFGVAHLEPGIAYHPIVRREGPIPTLTTAASVHVVTNVSDTVVAPQATVAAAWWIRRRHLVYVGTDLALAIRHRTRLVAGPLAGAQVRINPRFAVTLESKWLAPYYDVEPLAPTWISPGGHGYLSILLGGIAYFGEVE